LKGARSLNGLPHHQGVANQSVFSLQFEDQPCLYFRFFRFFKGVVHLEILDLIDDFCPSRHM
jgi:hypothetical protein